MKLFFAIFESFDRDFGTLGTIITKVRFQNRKCSFRNRLSPNFGPFSCINYQKKHYQLTCFLSPCISVKSAKKFESGSSGVSLLLPILTNLQEATFYELFLLQAPQLGQVGSLDNSDGILNIVDIVHQKGTLDQQQRWDGCHSKRRVTAGLIDTNVKLIRKKIKIW